MARDDNLILPDSITTIPPVTDAQRRRAGIYAASYCLETGTEHLLEQFLSQLGLKE